MLTLVQGKLFDRYGNYTITATDIGASPAIHQHAVGQVTDLNLNMYAAANHSHGMVKSISAAGVLLRNKVEIEFAGNISAARTDNIIQITKPVNQTDKVSVIGTGNLSTAIYRGTATVSKSSPESKHLLLVEDY